MLGVAFYTGILNAIVLSEVLLSFILLRSLCWVSHFYWHAECCRCWVSRFSGMLSVALQTVAYLLTMLNVALLGISLLSVNYAEFHILMACWVSLFWMSFVVSVAFFVFWVLESWLLFCRVSLWSMLWHQPWLLSTEVIV